MEVQQTLIPSQMRIVQWMFIDTADDNYATARWCFLKQLNVDFFWLAAQSLEKYMKAVLLLNGCSSKKYGHKLVPLYDRVSKLAPGLLPSELTKPDDLETCYWRKESPRNCIERFDKQGSPENRYQIYGYEREMHDLFKLDQLVFAIRRLCCPLDSFMFGKESPSANGSIHRDFLTRQPELQTVSNSSRLAKILKNGTDEELRAAILNLNLLFDQDASFEHGELRTGFSMHLSALYTEILRPAEKGSKGTVAKRAADLADWVLMNIQLPGEPRRKREPAKGWLTWIKEYLVQGLKPRADEAKQDTQPPKNVYQQIQQAQSQLSAAAVET